MTKNEVSITYFKKVENNAKKRNLEFNIDINYLYNLFLKQNRKCSLTGVNINLVTKSLRTKYELNTASLDRIDSNKGYIKGNVRWVHKNINHLKSDINDDDFIFLCNLITLNNDKPIQTNIDNVKIVKKRNNLNTINNMRKASSQKISVIQKDLNDNFIKEWESINSARDSLGYKSEMGIIGCCKGRQKSSGGYKWAYK